jgi:hypothetical protein
MAVRQSSTASAPQGGQASLALQASRSEAGAALLPAAVAREKAPPPFQPPPPASGRCWAPLGSPPPASTPPCPQRPGCWRTPPTCPRPAAPQTCSTCHPRSAQHKKGWRAGARLKLTDRNPPRLSRLAGRALEPALSPPCGNWRSITPPTPLPSLSPVPHAACRLPLPPLAPSTKQGAPGSARSGG